MKAKAVIAPMCIGQTCVKIFPESGLPVRLVPDSQGPLSVLSERLVSAGLESVKVPETESEASVREAIQWLHGTERMGSAELKDA